MINMFVTVGLEWFSFNRLIKIIDSFQETHANLYKIFIQTGRSDYKPAHCNCQNLLLPDQLLIRILNADIIICHAGVGSILFCIKNGKLPIVFPRRKELGEHVDNHQVDFCKRLAEDNIIPVAWQENELVEMIKNFSSIKSRYKLRDNNLSSNMLIQFLKNELNQIKFGI